MTPTADATKKRNVMSELPRLISGEAEYAELHRDLRRLRRAPGIRARRVR